MNCRLQISNPVNYQSRCAKPLNFCPHADEKFTEVHDVGLARRIINNCFAFREDSSS